MKIATLAVLTLCAGGAAAVAQEGMPPLPQPGPEHQVLKQDEGIWDATVEMWGAPEAAPAVSKGVETNTLGCGGLCLITDFKGEFMAQPFHGHGVATYNGAAKQYASTWMDSMSVGMMTGTATYDSSKKVMTGWMEGPDMTGKVSKTKSVTEWKDTDTRVFTMFEDGKDKPSMRITYKRRK